MLLYIYIFVDLHLDAAGNSPFYVDDTPFFREAFDMVQVHRRLVGTWGPQRIAKLVNITPIRLGFMAMK